MAIPTVEEAANRLHTILTAIREGVSDTKRSQISDQLLAFANPASDDAVPATAAYAELRETALRTSDDLDRQISSSSLKRIRGRSEALSRYVAAINAVSMEAQRDAAALKLSIINTVLDKSRNVIESVKKTKAAFEGQDFDEGFASIEETLDRIENLRAALPTS